MGSKPTICCRETLGSTIGSWRKLRSKFHELLLASLCNGCALEDTLSTYNKNIASVSCLHPKWYKKQSLTALKEESS